MTKLVTGKYGAFTKARKMPVGGLIFAAYTGESVIYVTDLAKDARNAMFSYMGMFQDLFDSVVLSDMLMKFPSGGSIRFTSLDRGNDSLRGLMADFYVMDGE